MANDNEYSGREFFERIAEVKELERTLISGDSPFPELTESDLGGLTEYGLSEKEVARFMADYESIVPAFIKKVIKERYLNLYQENRKNLEGTPEQKYILDLIESVGTDYVN